MTPELVPPPRRGLIGPFTGRQLLGILLVIVLVAIGLTLATRPIAAGPANATPIPVSTPFLVGPATEGLQPGQQAPELLVKAPDGTTVPLTDLDGNPVSLADLRGKLVWLNFWATWCPPCQSETPVLRDMDEAYGDKGLAIVGIAVQETTPADVQAYADKLPAGLRHRVRRVGRHLRPVQGLRPADAVLHRPVGQGARGRQRPDDRRDRQGPHRGVAAQERDPRGRLTRAFHTAERGPGASIVGARLVHLPAAP